MNAYAFHCNLVMAWLWVLLGFVAGFVLGTNFHRADWLGGYGSFPRRLCRLGHISFFGLGVVNLMFYLTARSLGLNSLWLDLASRAFVVGAAAMPICCFLIAFRPKLRALFLVPVLSLITAGLATMWEIIKL